MGSDPDTTYRPALDKRAVSLCSGKYRVLNESNPQVDAAIRRRDLERRPISSLSPEEQAALRTFEEAGFIWRIRCGEGAGWHAPSGRSLVKLDSLSSDEQRSLQSTMHLMNRIVANVPPLHDALFPGAVILIPSEGEMREFLGRRGSSTTRES